MTDHLFRSEAIEAQKISALSPLLIQHPRQAALGFRLVLLVTTLVLLALLFGRYTERITALGFLTTTEGMSRLYAPAQSGMVVDQVLISEGQWVEKGAPLWIGRHERYTPAGLGVESERLLQWEQQTRALKEQLEAWEALYVKKVTAFETQLEILEKNQSSLHQQNHWQQERLQLLETQTERLAALHIQGYVATLAYEQAQEQYLAQQQAAEEIKKQLVQLEQQVDHLKWERETWPIDYARHRDELKMALEELQHQQEELQATTHYTMVAPQSGYVTGLQIKAHQMLLPQQLTLIIVPDAPILYAELFVPTSQQGHIQTNQLVQVRYQAFPYQRYGSYEGQVIDVSQTVLYPQELSVPLPIQEPVYRVTVALNVSTLTLSPENHPLQPGMQLEADIIQEKKYFWEAMLAPLYRFKGASA